MSLLVVLLLAALPHDLAVSGVVLGPTPDRSSAILTSGGRTRVVMVGDSAFGGTVKAVESDKVTLDFDGETVVLRLPKAAPPAPPAAAPAAAQPSAPADAAPAPRAMQRAEVQRRLGEEIPRILAETAISPVLEDGRVVGVQLTRLPEGSLLSDAGLRVGDVITEINGTVIDGMATLVGLWPRLQSATELEAVVRRDGRPVSLRVSLH